LERAVVALRPQSPRTSYLVEVERVVALEGPGDEGKRRRAMVRMLRVVVMVRM